MIKTQFQQFTCLGVINVTCMCYPQVLDRVEQRREESRAAVFTFLRAINENPFPRPVSLLISAALSIVVDLSLSLQGQSVRVRALKVHLYSSAFH